MPTFDQSFDRPCRPRKKHKAKARGPKPPEPLHPEQWLEPGTLAFTIIFPDIARAYAAGEITYDEARRQAMRRLRWAVRTAMSKLRIVDPSSIEDYVQLLLIRLARMDVRTRYSPELASPLTFITGVARFIVFESVFRRKAPRPKGEALLANVTVDGDQLQRMVDEEAEEIEEGTFDRPQRHRHQRLNRPRQ